MMTDPRNETRASRRARSRGLAVCAPAIVAFAVWSTAAGEVRETLSREIETEPAKAARIAEASGGEVVTLKWKLAGVLGTLAGLFIPSSGDGLLTFVPAADDRIEIQLLLTAPKRDGEYFLYGATIDEATRSTAEVWSSYVYRDSHKDREQTVEAGNVIDFASAIYHLRWHAPTEPTRMTIWAGGKTYPVEIEPLGVDRRKVQGEKIDVRGYLVHGVKQDGREAFDDRFWLYFAADASSTPVEIVGKRSLVRVRMQMEPHSGGER